MSDRSAAHKTALEAEIARMIAIDGPMPLARFMALCLGHPEHGYYATRDPFGAAGDFITAPEISQMFGELIGLWSVSVWQQIGTPDPVHLVELGPGRGTLMADALRAAKRVPPFRAALRVALIETSPLLRQRQEAALAGADVPVAWHRDIAETDEGPLIVIANEFFDALPVHQAVRAADGWHERMVGLDEAGRLVLALHPDPLPGFAALLSKNLGPTAPGSVYEWRSGRLVEDLAQRIACDGGTVLIIDYGHAASAFGDTLQAVGRHRFADALERPGEIDLTAHVDFAALARSARRGGARAWGPMPQGIWLKRLGIEARAARLRAAAPARAAEIDAALERLTAPDEMGTLFKVMAITAGGASAPAGFDATDDAR
jgi:SAM-dependent MidA family methyltransferase